MRVGIKVSVLDVTYIQIFANWVATEDKRVIMHASTLYDASRISVNHMCVQLILHILLLSLL